MISPIAWFLAIDTPKKSISKIGFVILGLWLNGLCSLVIETDKYIHRLDLPRVDRGCHGHSISIPSYQGYL